MKNRVNLYSPGVHRTIPIALSLLVAPAAAQNLGMATDRDFLPPASVIVFDADADAYITEILLPDALDCEMLDNQTRGFVAGWDTGIHVIDLTAIPPVLVGPPIPTSTFYNENLSITRDQRFLLVSDGSNQTPISIIDIATLTEISSIGGNVDHTSSSVSENGSVATTSWGMTGAVRRYELNSFGVVTGPADVAPAPWSRYTAFSPTNNFLVANSYGAVAELRSYGTIGLVHVDTAFPGGEVVSALMHPSADLYYTRLINGEVQAWQYDHSTGQFPGAGPLQTQTLGTVTPYFGVDQLALHPDKTKLYALDDQNGLVRILNPSTLAPMGTVSMPAGFNNPAGLCFRTVSTPLAVELSYFKANRAQAGVVVRWGTAAEIDNAGFNLYREAWSPNPTGTPTASATLVNTNLIPATGSSYETTPYRMLDSGVLTGQAYNYWLVDMDIHGETTTHGPIAVR